MGKKYLKTAPLREVTDVKFLWPPGQKRLSKVSIFAASNKKNVAETLQENQIILILLQKYVYTKIFSTISTWPMVYNMFSITKRNLIIIFQESSYLFEESLLLSEGRL